MLRLLYVTFTYNILLVPNDMLLQPILIDIPGYIVWNIEDRDGNFLKISYSYRSQDVQVDMNVLPSCR